mmetsp:Transcript_23103/g.74302  ORF Transcript_23103/g.74302 Transcript_23103/m.74302 type:complete len:234 (-) Transcript_23103:38-739(-)
MAGSGAATALQHRVAGRKGLGRVFNLHYASAGHRLHARVLRDRGRQLAHWHLAAPGDPSRRRCDAGGAGHRSHRGRWCAVLPLWYCQVHGEFGAAADHVGRLHRAHLVHRWPRAGWLATPTADRDGVRHESKTALRPPRHRHDAVLLPLCAARGDAHHAGAERQRQRVRVVHVQQLAPGLRPHAHAPLHHDLLLAQPRATAVLACHCPTGDTPVGWPRVGRDWRLVHLGSRSQ